MWPAGRTLPRPGVENEISAFKITNHPSLDFLDFFNKYN